MKYKKDEVSLALCFQCVKSLWCGSTRKLPLGEAGKNQLGEMIFD